MGKIIGLNMANRDVDSDLEAAKPFVVQEAYWENWKRRSVPLDTLNILVPKSARVEYQRLHWKENNGGKLMVSICPPTKQAIFGKLPREKTKVGRHIRTVCGICKVPFLKATYDSQNSY